LNGDFAATELPSQSVGAFEFQIRSTATPATGISPGKNEFIAACLRTQFDQHICRVIPAVACRSPFNMQNVGGRRYRVEHKSAGAVRHCGVNSTNYWVLQLQTRPTDRHVSAMKKIPKGSSVFSRLRVNQLATNSTGSGS